MGPCYSRGKQEQTTASFACSFPKGMWACYLYGVKVGVCPGVRPEGWLKWFAPTSGGVECRGHMQYPAFALYTLLLFLTLQKWQFGFWSLFILLSIICLNCACRQFFLVLFSFFVFCCLGGVSRCTHYRKGSQVPAWLPAALAPYSVLTHPPSPMVASVLSSLLANGLFQGNNCILCTSVFHCTWPKQVCRKSLAWKM